MQAEVHLYRTLESVIVSTRFFLLFLQLGMFSRLYKIYEMMQTRVATKPTFHLI